MDPGLGRSPGEGNGYPLQYSGLENSMHRGACQAIVHEMVGWHHQLDGHQFEQAPGDDDVQGSLVCCSPWGHEESGVTEHAH